MERNPFSRNSAETHSEGSADDKSKKSTGKKSDGAVSETVAEPDRKQRVEQDIAHSINRLFEQPKKLEAVGETADEPAETLSDDETVHAQQEIARDHLEAIEQADPDIRDELAPAADFLERVEDGTDPEIAFREIAAEAGLADDEIDSALAEAPLPESDAEAEPETDDVASDDLPESVIDTPVVPEGYMPLDAPAATAGGGRGHGGGRRTTTSSAASLPSGGLPASTPVAAAIVTPNRLPPAAATHYESAASRRNRAGQLVLVGIVGYLVGRRRGRLNTEKRLQPVQRKLEKQVTQLERDITFKEQQLVAIKAERSVAPAVVPEMPTAKLKPAIERTQPGRQETRLGLEKPQRVERLGQMILAAEAPKPAVKPVERVSAIKPEAVQELRRNDLLELSEKIVVEGANLRRIYESRLIGERQLRHLVSEHLQGKDIRDDLRREMVEHEIDFERDPILRDRVRSHLQGGGTNGLSSLLKSVGIVDEDAPDPQLQRHIEKEAQRQQDAMRKSQRQRAMADTAMATAVIVLAVVVLILALGR